MGKYSWSKFDFNKLVPVIEKAGSGLKKVGKVVGEVVKDRNFQIGALASLPASVGAFFLIRRYKKQARGKRGNSIKKLWQNIMPLLKNWIPRQNWIEKDRTDYWPMIRRSRKK